MFRKRPTIEHLFLSRYCQSEGRHRQLLSGKLSVSDGDLPISRSRQVRHPATRDITARTLGFLAFRSVAVTLRVAWCKLLAPIGSLTHILTAVFEFQLNWSMFLVFTYDFYCIPLMVVFAVCRAEQQCLCG